MQRRICNVLIVANPYDAFMLEDDGRVDEKIFAEYARLGLRFPPRFIKASSLDEAEQRIETNDIDLVIVMPSRTADAQEEDVFEIAKTIKLEHNNIPIVVLTPFSHGITARMQDIDLSLFEYVFCWLGNTELLLTIIKLLEDKMNLEHDVEAGVRMILVVEDNIRFYSSILPSLYQFVLKQSLEFAQRLARDAAYAWSSEDCAGPQLRRGVGPLQPVQGQYPRRHLRLPFPPASRTGRQSYR